MTTTSGGCCFRYFDLVKQSEQERRCDRPPRDRSKSGAATVMATVRNLKIKTGTCKRVVKELHSYEKEVEREAAKTAEMKEKGADPYDLKQQENVLAESRMMIPDCRKRLEASLADLKATLAELEESNQKEGVEIEEAQSTIADVERFFESTEA
ncbi:hypothetical protein NL676_009281 [Syzygium grande]|nr:hypothetical protein NL676_009281 [Syzygium grande]